MWSILHLGTEHGIPDSKCANFLRVTLWVMFQCECSAALFVDIAVWGVLMPSAGDDLYKFLSFGSMSMHFVNFVCLGTEIFLNDIPIPFHFGCFSFVPPTIYILFSWGYYAAGGRWDYFFVDPTDLGNIIWMLMIVILLFVTWSLVWYMGKRKVQWHQNRKQKGMEAGGDILLNPTDDAP